MAEHVVRCPLCSSVLFISEKVLYYSNPQCSYVSDLATNKVNNGSDLPINLLPLAFILITIILIFVFINLIFAETMIFLFIPIILPIPFLRRLIKKKRSTS